MHRIDFLATDEKQLKERRKEFGLLQNLLAKGFNPRTAEESIIFGDIRKKIRGISEENGDICFWCGTVKRIPDSNFIARILQSGGATLELENEEHRLMTECLKNAPKQGMFDYIEDINELVRRFSDSKKVEKEEKPAENKTEEKPS